MSHLKKAVSGGNVGTNILNGWRRLHARHIFIFASVWVRQAVSVMLIFMTVGIYKCTPHLLLTSFSELCCYSLAAIKMMGGQATTCDDSSDAKEGNNFGFMAGGGSSLDTANWGKNRKVPFIQYILVKSSRRHVTVKIGRDLLIQSR